MNLVIDVGNTVVKSAIFNKKEIVDLIKFSNDDFINKIEQFISRHSAVSDCIVSSVGRLDEYQIKWLSNKISTLILNSDTSLPFINRYQTPKTLGVDRIALVSAAVANFPEKNALIIDAGTCITYDFVDSEKNYDGGAISPGLRLRYKSLNNFTANLPLLDINRPKNIVGDSTLESIHSGVVNGVIFEIEGAIETYKENYLDLTVILTGGDSKFLSDQLKNSIFANSNFLLEGLNHILDYNRRR